MVTSLLRFTRPAAKNGPALESGIFLETFSLTTPTGRILLDAMFRKFMCMTFESLAFHWSRLKDSKTSWSDVNISRSKAEISIEFAGQYLLNQLFDRLLADIEM